MRVFFKRLGILFWWIFIGYGFLLFVLICNAWVYPEIYDGARSSWSGESLIVYFPLLIVVIIVCLFVKRKAIFAPLFILALIISEFSFGFVRAFVVAMEFWTFNFPAATDVENYCHPVKFMQDGNIYKFGVCGDEVPDEDGQTGFGPEIVYDTSGDIAYSTYSFSGDGQIFKPERKEFVDAVRKFYNDDPEEAFEVADFQTTPIYGHFYVVVTDDVGGGFTDTYGPPPYDKKNRINND